MSVHLTWGARSKRSPKDVACSPVQKQVILLHAQKSVERLEACVEHDAGAALK